MMGRMVVASQRSFWSFQIFSVVNMQVLPGCPRESRGLSGIQLRGAIL